MYQFQYDIRPGRYRHFKGNEYQVLGMARHSETEEEMVVYRPLYGEGGLWVRPAAMWAEVAGWQTSAALYLYRRVRTCTVCRNAIQWVLQGKQTCETVSIKLRHRKRKTSEDKNYGLYYHPCGQKSLV